MPIAQRHLSAQVSTLLCGEVPFRATAPGLELAAPVLAQPFAFGLLAEAAGAVQARDAVVVHVAVELGAVVFVAVQRHDHCLRQDQPAPVNRSGGRRTKQSPLLVAKWFHPFWVGWVPARLCAFLRFQPLPELF